MANSIVSSVVERFKAAKWVGEEHTFEEYKSEMSKVLKKYTKLFAATSTYDEVERVKSEAFKVIYKFETRWIQDEEDREAAEKLGKDTREEITQLAEKRHAEREKERDAEFEKYTLERQQRWNALSSFEKER